MPTNETTKELNFPSAAMLNLSMSAREFDEIIYSTIDMSSLSTALPISTTGVPGGAAMESERNDEEHLQDKVIKLLPMQNRSDSTSSVIFESIDEIPRPRNGGKNEESSRIQKDGDGDTREQQTESFVPEQNDTASSGKDSSGMSLLPYSMAAATAQVAGETMAEKSNPIRRSSWNHRDPATKHHRRLSSSLVVLEEWAQENRVRDMYGAAPPADLPHEIAWMLENENDPPPRSLTTAECNEFAAPPASTHVHRSQQHLWFSPPASPYGTFGNRDPASRNTGRPIPRSPRGRSDENSLLRTPSSRNKYKQDSLEEPLQPLLRVARDEELGEGTSELLGERLLRSG